jgi:2,3,4,5-tetrahydropyridine-2-carboxylate N-succinyltransferase
VARGGAGGGVGFTIVVLMNFVTQHHLEPILEHWFAQGPAAIGNSEALEAFQQLRDNLEDGTLRSASPDAASPTGWTVNAWVKRGILLGFRLGALEAMNGNHPDGGSMLSFVDKDTYPARRFVPEQGIRIVPGGSSVRSGAYLARGVVMMPPAYVNVGAFVDEGTMIDSHALVGSCAQIGKRVHLSAAAQIGGVLEPVNASPVIIEDDALIGGNTGVYEGTIVRSRAVLAAGVILTRGTPVYDLVHNTILKATAEGPLIIPAGAVVVAGSRAIQTEPGKGLGLSVYTPIIVKYRDEKTDLSTALEDLLR